MKTAKGILVLVLLSTLGTWVYSKESKKTWQVKADYIEACSCHLFCPCYFNPSPEGSHHCEFNNAVKVVAGHVGDVKVDGTKFWLSGDLGGDFSKGEMKTAVATFEPSATPEQREALKFLIGQIYPVKWEKMVVDSAPIAWEMKGMNAHAKLGDKAEVNLTGVKDDHGKQQIIKNLKYWGAQKNDGFYLAKSEHYYKGNGLDYQYKDRNGFTIHIESEGLVANK